MFQMSNKTMQLINKACKGKRNLKLTVGYLAGDHSVVKIYNDNGELDPSEKYFYEIGSITKTFTVSLLAKYVYEKKLSIDDSIDKFIEGLKEAEYYPTLLDLATYTSGYSVSLPLSKREYIGLMLSLITGSSDMNRNNPLHIDVNKMKMLIETNKLKRKDYSWQYSNFGMSLIGYILGKISGRGYWDLMNDFLQNELGLGETYIGTNHNNLPGYDRKNNDCGNWKWNKENLISPAGAMSSTAHDLLKYAKINLATDKPYMSLGHQKYRNARGKYHMGLGWWLLKKNNNVILHGGGTGCFSSFLGIDKEKGVAAVVLANYRLNMNGEGKIGMSLLENLQE